MVLSSMRLSKIRRPFRTGYPSPRHPAIHQPGRCHPNRPNHQEAIEPNRLWHQYSGSDEGSRLPDLVRSNRVDVPLFGRVPIRGKRRSGAKQYRVPYMSHCARPASRRTRCPGSPQENGLTPQSRPVLGQSLHVRRSHEQQTRAFPSGGYKGVRHPPHTRLFATLPSSRPRERLVALAFPPPTTIANCAVNGA